MNKLTTIAELLKRVRRKPELAACAIAALLFLAALPAPARAQNTYGGRTEVYAGSIGLVPGQSVTVTVPNSYCETGGVRVFAKHSIKVYETRASAHGVTERSSGLIYSGESGGINEQAGPNGDLYYDYGVIISDFDHLPRSLPLPQVITFSYGDLRVPGEPRTGRVEVWIVIESFLPSSTQTRAEDRSADVLSPTFQLIDEPSGRTTVRGGLVKLGSKLLVLQSDGTYGASATGSAPAR